MTLQEGKPEILEFIPSYDEPEYTTPVMTDEVREAVDAGAEQQQDASELFARKTLESQDVAKGLIQLISPIRDLELASDTYKNELAKLFHEYHELGQSEADTYMNYLFCFVDAKVLRQEAEEAKDALSPNEKVIQAGENDSPHEWQTAVYYKQGLEADGVTPITEPTLYQIHRAKVQAFRKNSQEIVKLDTMLAITRQVIAELKPQFNPLETAIEKASEDLEPNYAHRARLIQRKQELDAFFATVILAQKPSAKQEEDQEMV